MGTGRMKERRDDTVGDESSEEVRSVESSVCSTCYISHLEGFHKKNFLCTTCTP